MENNEPVIGVIFFPILNKIIYASQGNGCWLQNNNDTPIKVFFSLNNKKKLENSVISASGIHSTTYNTKEGNKAYKLSKIVSIAKDFIFINDCYQHCMVAMQRIDAAIDTLMKPWDISALLICMKESGVICSDIKGSQKKLLWADSLITASSQYLLDKIVNELN
ncbi:hypothetical protein FD728_04705 (plasmid) [Pantoea sp. Aalb]|nr:hypothetical protein [Pantoea sp. Aalb]